jgi:hypothetical protein
VSSIPFRHRDYGYWEDPGYYYSDYSGYFGDADDEFFDEEDPVEKRFLDYEAGLRFPETDCS